MAGQGRARNEYTNCKYIGHTYKDCRFKGGGQEREPFPPKIGNYCKVPGLSKNECPQLMKKLAETATNLELPSHT